jgi:ferredoxin-NADP reductase
MNDSLAVRVSAISQLTPWIKEFCLEPVDAEELPAFSPGSHIVMELGNAGAVLRNAYSLTSSPFDRSHYRIAVRHHEDSRGGSKYLHNEVEVGQVFSISPPSNYFHFEQGAEKLLLIAGGIGITPFMSLLSSLTFRSEMPEMHYSFRSMEDAAYLDELEQQLGPALHCYERDKGDRLEVGALLATQPLGTQVYVCGPEGLIEAVRDEARQLQWPEGSVHFEKFAVKAGGRPFSVRLQRSKRSIQVESEESLLEALEKNGIEVSHLCRAGVCGECRTVLLQGEAGHRDLFLSEEEKTGGGFIMPCVSRARKEGELVLDL